MSPSFADTLFTAVAEFVAGRIPSRELRERTTPAIYTADETGDADAAFLADEMILRFAEADHGHWTEEGLRELLARFLRDEFPDRLLPDAARIMVVTGLTVRANISTDEMSDHFIALLAPSALHRTTS